MIGRLITLTNLNRLLQRLQSQQLARPERFELPTPRFEAWCSIQLSYGRSGRRCRQGAKSITAFTWSH